MFIFNIVLLDGKICSERMKLNQKSSLETHFEATVTRFEVSSEFGRKSKVKRSGPGRVAKGPRGPAGIRLLGLGGGAKFPNGAEQGKFTFMAPLRER